jgi:hypothetical protein
MKITSIRTRFYLITLLSIFFLSCQQGFPPDPEVKKFYLVVLNGDMNPTCIEYDVLNYIPFKVGNAKFKTIEACEMVGGFKPEDVKKITTYMYDVKKWGEMKESQCR